MTGRLSGKVALISGGARGQGAAEVRTFVAEGAAVVFGDVLDDQGEALAEEVGDRCRYVHLDVTQEDDWAEAVRTTVDTFGGPHVLVGNAGIIGTIMPIPDVPPAEYRRVVEVNQVGMFLGLHATIPAMSAPGSIVLISSVAGILGGPNAVAYSSSKFAVRGLAKIAALELASKGIRANSVHPGAIDTPMLDSAPGSPDFRPAMAAVTPLGRLGQVDEVAELVCWLASDASSYCTGGEFVVDGGVHAGPSVPR